MKTLYLGLLALGLAASASHAQGDKTSTQGAGSSQQDTYSSPGTPSDTSNSRTHTDLGADRRDKSGTDQGYNTGATGSAVGRDRGTVNRSDIDRANADRDVARGDRGARGTGVATGFVAAGIGLALLGLFVRRRNRRYDRYDDYSDRPGGTSGTMGGGSGRI